MTMLAIVLFTLMTNSGVGLDWVSLNSLVKNKPGEAIQAYQIALSRDDLTLRDYYRLHSLAIRAGAITFNNSVLLTALEALKNKDFNALIEENKVKLLANIGVAYRYREQNQQAIWHYRCAMNEATSSQYKAALKVNIAIAYTRINQPSLGYSLLKNIEKRFLPDYMRAGLATALGNITFALGESEEALRYFQEAAKQYRDDENYKAMRQVSVNSLGIHLLNEDFASYHKVLAEVELDDELMSAKQHYLSWLTELERLLKQGSNKPNLNTPDIMKAYALGAAKEDYAAMVNAHIDKFSLSIPKVDAQIVVKEPLPIELGKPWCLNL
ncbi:hypothetical protein HUZ36_10510 [Pseudoalteromonas sp. McH1-7]|nr:hypothetical protein [Pseudoalteromonas sp. McH1-7]